MCWPCGSRPGRPGMKLPEGFDHRPGWITPRRADRLFQRLWRQLDWCQHEVFLFGRKIRQPRLSAWYSDAGVAYRYSGLTLRSAPWHPDLARLREELADLLGRPFNSVLANAYRDGRDTMGWHADDEPELGTQPVIASVSLGATRRMLLRPAGGGPSIGMDLPDGSLLVMSGPSQSDWRHCIPRTNKPVGTRINLTFRWIR